MQRTQRPNDWGSSPGLAHELMCALSLKCKVGGGVLNCPHVVVLARRLNFSSPLPTSQQRTLLTELLVLGYTKSCFLFQGPAPSRDSLIIHVFKNLWDTDLG